MVPILNALAFDGMTAHWEFAYGPDHFKSIVEKLDFPMLAINCYYKETDKLVFPPFQIVERDGLSIGVIGIAATIVDKTTDTKRIAGDILIQIDQKLSTNNVMEQSVETLINVCC